MSTNQKRSRVKSAKGRSVSSTLWLKRHINDQYVREAKSSGYRSRAAFKLLEINEKYRLLSECKGAVIDLGCAPGSWLQVLTATVTPGTAIIGIDLSEVTPVPGVKIIQGDFSDEIIQKACLEAVAGRSLDLILSDMAPPASGNKDVDHLRILSLARAAIAFGRMHLRVGGSLVFKIFPGTGFDSTIKALRSCFQTVAIFKPKASYKDSKEIFIVARSLIQREVSS